MFPSSSFSRLTFTFTFPVTSTTVARADLAPLTFNSISSKDANGSEIAENSIRQLDEVEGGKMSQINHQQGTSCCGHQQNQPAIQMNNSNGTIFGNGNSNNRSSSNSNNNSRVIVDGSSNLNSIIYTSTVEANICTCPPGTCQKDGTCCSTCPSGNLCETCESPPSSSSSNSSISSLASGVSSPASPANLPPGINYMSHHSMSCSPSLSNFISPSYITAQPISH